jgi:hypothetical protein
VTTWGGADVTRFAQAAGFDAVQSKRATAIAFAVSRFNDHYEQRIAGVPSMDQLGLWGLHPEMGPTARGLCLFDPVTSAKVLQHLWSEAGGTFEWMPVFSVRAGDLVRQAWTLLDDHRLWQTRARDMIQTGASPIAQPA